MTAFICRACDMQYQDQPAPPAQCVVCTDDRQYVDWGGQAWTSNQQLSDDHVVRIATDGDLLGLDITPSFAIPQRAILIRSETGNILWDCLSLVTPEAVEAVRAQGGIDLIAVSHPHFYSAMIDWSDAFDGVPILLHHADRSWVQRTSSKISFWSGDSRQLSPNVTLHHCPGHFPGSALLHWSAAPNGRNIILAGDTLQVGQNRAGVSFIHSAPNAIPLHPDHVREIRRRLDGLPIDDIYGFRRGLNIIGDARRSLDDSFERYFAAVGQPTGRPSGRRAGGRAPIPPQRGN